MEKKFWGKRALLAMAAMVMLTACGEDTKRKPEESLYEISTPEGSIDDPYGDIGGGGDVQYVDAETGEPIDLNNLSAEDLLGISWGAYSEWQGLSYQKSLTTDEGTETTDFLLDGAGNVHVKKEGTTEGEMYLIKRDEDKYDAYVKEKSGSWAKSMGIDNPVTPEYLADKKDALDALFFLGEGLDMKYDGKQWTLTGNKSRDDIASSHVDEYFFLPEGKPVHVDQLGHAGIECPVEMAISNEGFFLDKLHIELSRLANADPEVKTKSYVLDLASIKVEDLPQVNLPDEVKDGSQQKKWADIDSAMPTRLADAD